MFIVVLSNFNFLLFQFYVWFYIDKEEKQKLYIFRATRQVGRHPRREPIDTRLSSEEQEKKDW